MIYSTLLIYSSWNPCLARRVLRGGPGACVLSVGVEGTRFLTRRSPASQPARDCTPHPCVLASRAGVTLPSLPVMLCGVSSGHGGGGGGGSIEGEVGSFESAVVSSQRHMSKGG
ncbi:hypothetical protein E2C01_072905 [Portunus trituberculatus]|uniref:Uncharacterized protein n=1 Tax=Portunus trituberculatus TaxID=210409 RepID=A0A5B7I952_PORTR|nr:hypothetical protein [Portunus trituberculatus]